MLVEVRDLAGESLGSWDNCTTIGDLREQLRSKLDLRHVSLVMVFFGEQILGDDSALLEGVNASEASSGPPGASLELVCGLRHVDAFLEKRDPDFQGR